tara:strand:- start:144 stop:833 length:690 start_codon:yes stop_codon:yes gene_type:complete
MTDQERNETPVATFNHQDPYEVPLLDETPAPAETPATEVDTEVDNTPEPVVDEGEPAPPPSNPVTMKDSLDDYLDEELASSVKALVDKVGILEAELHKEKASNKSAKKVVEATEKFDSVWVAEASKYGKVLETGGAKDRVLGSMEVLKAGMKATGQPVPSEGDLFAKAVAAEYGNSMVDSREEELMNRVSERQSQFVSRANSGQTRIGDKPEDRAARAVARIMSERGLR